MTEWLIGALAALAGIGWIVRQAYVYRRYPWVNCSRCAGSGKARQPEQRRAFGDCRKCRGSGKQLRLGWRLRNGLSRRPMDNPR